MKNLVPFLALLQVSSVVVSVHSLPASTSQAKSAARANRGLEATKTTTGKRASQVGAQGPKQRTRKEALVTLIDPSPDASADDLYKQARITRLGTGEDVIHSDDHHRIVKHMVQSTQHRLQHHYERELAKHQAVTEALKALHQETYHRAERFKQQLASISGKSKGLVKAPHALGKSVHSDDDIQGTQLASSPLSHQQRQHQQQTVLPLQQANLHHDHSRLGVDANDPLYDDTSFMSLLQQPSQSHAQHSPASFVGQSELGYSQSHSSSRYSDVNAHHPASTDVLGASPPPRLSNAVYHTNTHHDVAYNDPHIRAFHKYDPTLDLYSGASHHHIGHAEPRQETQHYPDSYAWPHHPMTGSHIPDQGSLHSNDHLGTMLDYQRFDDSLLANNMRHA